MCDPLTIAGLALSAGSAAANSAAESRVAHARTAALSTERARQNGLDQQAEAINTQSQDRFKNLDQQTADKGAQLGDYFASQSTPMPTAAEALPSAGGSNITVQEEDKQRAKAAAMTGATGHALGELRSFGDVLGGLSRQQAQDASAVGQIGGFKTGSSNVLPYELDAANAKGNGLKMLGDILGGLGSVATSAGLTGGTLFGMGAPKAASLGGAAVRGATGSAIRLPNLYTPGHL